MPKGRVKPRRERPLAERVVDTRELRERFLIVCEGEKTEPHYFKSFRVPKDVMTVVGAGANTRSLVERAIEWRGSADEYDQVWCVFDRDSFPAQHFNEALQLAKRENIHVAYSNEAFELWYLLHFDFQNTAIPRSDYGKRLSERLGFRYEKNSKRIYDELEMRIPMAIRNARRLSAMYDPPNPEQDNPSTTVYLLVEQLMRFVPAANRSLS